MATKKKTVSVAADERKGRARFVDQPGQWRDITPASVKKKQAKEWDKLSKMMSKGSTKKKK